MRMRYRSRLMLLVSAGGRALFAMAMMGSRSSVDGFDDGTHGDAVAGEGVYSCRDVDGHIGPHREDCVTGEYLYTFHETDVGGSDTNPLDVRVTVR